VEEARSRRDFFHREFQALRRERAVVMSRNDLNGMETKI
jgi:hypothetical protein